MARRPPLRPPGVPILEHLRTLLAEMDLRYQQRFDAQNTALDAARLAAKEGVTTALTAAEKAVNKAEIAAEKRFESVNEFRAQLTDQAATFLQRTEYLTAHQSLTEKISDLSARVDRAEAANAAGHETRVDSRLSLNTIIAAGAFIVSALLVYLAFRK